MTSDIDLNELRAKCEAATQPGPWTVRGECGRDGDEFIVDDRDGMWVAECGRDEHNSAFIAALSPDVVMKLLARLESAERERDEARACLVVRCEYELELQAQRDAAVAELDELKRHHAAVVTQHNKDWDALTVEIAKAVGTDEDREGAEQGEIEEFDPWHALRTFVDRAESAERDLAEARRERDEWKERWFVATKTLGDMVGERDAAQAALSEAERVITDHGPMLLRMRDEAARDEAKRIAAWFDSRGSHTTAADIRAGAHREG